MQWSGTATGWSLIFGRAMLCGVRFESVKMIEAQPRTTWPERETTPFSDWLDARLRSARMSQRQLAMRSGVHHSTISRLVRHRRTPSFDTAVRLAKVLDPTGTTPIARPTDAHPSSPPMRVEHALRSDPSLAANDVRDLMRGYLRLRARRDTAVGPRESPRANLHRVRGGQR